MKFFGSGSNDSAEWWCSAGRRSFLENASISGVISCCLLCVEMLLRSMEGWLESLDAGMKEGEGGYHRVFLKGRTGTICAGRTRALPQEFTAAVILLRPLL